MFLCVFGVFTPLTTKTRPSTHSQMVDLIKTIFSDKKLSKSEITSPSFGLFYFSYFFTVLFSYHFHRVLDPYLAEPLAFESSGWYLSTAKVSSRYGETIL